MLEFNLVENLLTAAPDDFMAQVTNVRSFNDSEIADRMLQSGAGLTKSDILSVLESYKGTVCNIIADGGAVDTALFVLRPSIAGVFNSASDTFSPSRHQIKSNLHQGVAIRDAVQKIKTQKVQVIDPVPNITQVKDVVNGANDHITAGLVLEISGSRLKILFEDDSNGIFLIPLSGGKEIKLLQLVENKPARLMAMIPASIEAGEYYLEVRTTWSGNTKPSKTLKTGRFHKILTIA
jgi:hypothetical protein